MVTATELSKEYHKWLKEKKIAHPILFLMSSAEIRVIPFTERDAFIKELRA